MRFTDYKPNQVILILIFSIFILMVAANLTTPFFALYITEDIAAATGVVGFAGAVYLIAKSSVQLPIARWIDRHHGERDDYYALLIGTAITTVGVFLFSFADQLWRVIFIQILVGVGDAFAVPPIFTIFTRHIDRGAEGYDWMLESSFSFGAGSAIGSVLAGLLIGTLGVRGLFLMNGTLMILRFMTPLSLRIHILPRVSPLPVDRFLLAHQRRG